MASFAHSLSLESVVETKTLSTSKFSKRNRISHMKLISTAENIVSDRSAKETEI